jgi:hypothetical protein
VPPGAGGRFAVRMCGLQRARSQGAAAPICRVLLTACVQRSTRHLACMRWRRDAHVGRPPAVAPAVAAMGCLLPVARLCATAGCGLCGRRARSSSQPTGRPSVPFAALPRFNPNAASRAACSVPDAAACKRSQLVLSGLMQHRSPARAPALSGTLVTSGHRSGCGWCARARACRRLLGQSCVPTRKSLLRAMPMLCCRRSPPATAYTYSKPPTPDARTHARTVIPIAARCRARRAAVAAARRRRSPHCTVRLQQLSGEHCRGLNPFKPSSL